MNFSHWFIFKFFWCYNLCNIILLFWSKQIFGNVIFVKLLSRLSQISLVMHVAVEYDTIKILNKIVDILKFTVLVKILFHWFTFYPCQQNNVSWNTLIENKASLVVVIFCHWIMGKSVNISYVEFLQVHLKLHTELFYPYFEGPDWYKVWILRAIRF